jgi:hypothetical protein
MGIALRDTLTFWTTDKPPRNKTVQKQPHEQYGFHHS